MASRRYDEARLSARNALATARDAEFLAVVAVTLQHLAAIGALRPDADAQELEDRRRPARLLGFVDARLAALEVLREYIEQQEYDKILAALRNALSEDQLAQLMDEGRAWSEDQAVAEAMLI